MKAIVERLFMYVTYDLELWMNRYFEWQLNSFVVFSEIEFNFGLRETSKLNHTLKISLAFGLKLNLEKYYLLTCY